MKDVILKADGLYFSYEGEKNHSLNGLSLEIERGKKIAFMGANGSGKSTFFLCCNGIHKPVRGQLYLDGQPYDYSKKGLLKLRQRVGIVFQDPDNQLFSASVYQEISFGILNLGVSEEEAQKEVEKGNPGSGDHPVSPQAYPRFKRRPEKTGFHRGHSGYAPGHYDL